MKIPDLMKSAATYISSAVHFGINKITGSNNAAKPSKIPEKVANSDINSPNTNPKALLSSFGTPPLETDASSNYNKTLDNIKWLYSVEKNSTSAIKFGWGKALNENFPKLSSQEKLTLAESNSKTLSNHLSFKNKAILFFQTGIML